MPEDSWYYYRRPHVDEPSKTTTGFFRSFDKAFEAMAADVGMFFGCVNFEEASGCDGVVVESGEDFAVVSYGNIVWATGQVV